MAPKKRGLGRGETQEANGQAKEMFWDTIGGDAFNSTLKAKLRRTSVIVLSVGPSRFRIVSDQMHLRFENEGSIRELRA